MDNMEFKFCKVDGHQFGSAICAVRCVNFADNVILNDVAHTENGRGGIFISQECKMRVLQERNLGSTISS